jgi:stage III sporulation protein SpoIIIAA
MKTAIAITSQQQNTQEAMCNYHIWQHGQEVAGYITMATWKRINPS